MTFTIRNKMLRQIFIFYIPIKNQSGLSIIATVLAMVLFTLIAAFTVSLVTTGTNIGLQEQQGVEAFFIAEGGLDYTFAKNKASIPNYSTNGNYIPLGSGEFKVDTPAYLTDTDGLSKGETPINVDSTARFPSTPSPQGRLAIGTDFKITYTGTTATSFTGASKGEAHSQNDSVYPAAKLTDTLLANCTDLATINVNDDLGTGNDVGFDIRRPFFIDAEYFLCASKTTNQFQTCTRCYLGSSAAVHNPSSYAAQYILTSTGRVTNLLVTNVVRVVQISTGPDDR